jgi:hypothetical protein
MTIIYDIICIIFPYLWSLLVLSFETMWSLHWKGLISNWIDIVQKNTNSKFSGVHNSSRGSTPEMSSLHLNIPFYCRSSCVLLSPCVAMEHKGKPNIQCAFKLTHDEFHLSRVMVPVYVFLCGWRKYTRGTTSPFVIWFFPCVIDTGKLTFLVMNYINEIHYKSFSWHATYPHHHPINICHISTQTHFLHIICHVTLCSTQTLKWLISLM